MIFWRFSKPEKEQKSTHFFFHLYLARNKWKEGWFKNRFLSCSLALNFGFEDTTPYFKGKRSFGCRTLHEALTEKRKEGRIEMEFSDVGVGDL